MYKRHRRSIRVSTGLTHHCVLAKIASPHPQRAGAHQEPGNSCKALWTSKWKEKTSCEHKHMYTCTHTQSLGGD